ncbi:hypothetical protein AHAS_Ahas09G0099000 [Arachis hypogaea]
MSNPREECKAITLVSEHVTDVEVQVSKGSEETEAPEKTDDAIAHASLKAPEYKPKMSYPQKLQKETKDKQFS